VNSRWEYINTDFATRYEQLDGEHIFYTTASGTADAAITWSEAMRIDDSGNVGIKTSSPTSYGNSQATLVIEDTSSPAIAWSDTGQARDWFAVAQGSGLFFNYADGGGSGSATNVTNVLTLDNSGNVGIGTSSPSQNLTVGFADNGTDGISFRSSTYANLAKILVQNETSTQNGNLQFYTRSGGDVNEAMRIDSSGNLLVGKMSDNNALEGISLAATGAVKATNSNDLTGIFNRLATDGDIVQFWKDGSTVGSIGAKSSQLYIGTGDTALKFLPSSNQIVPADTNNGQGRGSAIDLGQDGTAFKDLYLSGGVVFDAVAGSATSNTLDDYEEGTWTPATYGASTATISSVEGLYTKIGNMVYASFTFNVDTNSDSAHLRIHGLPFTVGSSQAARGGVIIGYQNSGTACVGNGVNSATRFSFSTLSGSDVLFSTFSNKVLRGVYVYSV
jgi:hypothetical protein